MVQTIFNYPAILEPDEDGRACCWASRICPER